MDGRNEDDGGFLEARMLADHRGQLEPVQLRHADIDENNRDLGLEQVLQGLSGRGCLDEILSEVTQNHFKGQ